MSEREGEREVRMSSFLSTHQHLPGNQVGVIGKLSNETF